MKYKPDWGEAQKRLTALWHGEIIDRPCIAVRALGGNNVPRSRPESPEQKWIDPEFVAADAVASFENAWFGGEAIPSYLVMSGWIVCFGGTPRFEMETIWWEEMEFDFERPPRLGFDACGYWEKRFEKTYMALVEACGRSDALAGHPAILPANDLLSMLMGTNVFLTNLVDRPDWMREAIVRGARAQVDAHRFYQAQVKERHDYWYGNPGWMPFWAPEPYVSTQSDVSCMLSPEMYDEFVLPELEVLHEGCGPLWYHLDGVDARQHLDRLLSLPFLRVLQYTPAPCELGNGPEHLEFYRKVQAAGKIVHIALSQENVEPLVRELDPGLLMLDTHCGSIGEGEALLEAARSWC